MRTIIAHYRVSSEFQVPKSIPLLSVEDNEGNVLGKKTPWSWWIKYDTLYYYDANCNLCEISPTCPAYESSDYKYPYEEEEGSDGEEESEEEVPLPASKKKKKPVLAPSKPVKESCCKNINKGTTCQHYCDVHENVQLIHDGNGGWCCEECDN